MVAFALWGICNAVAELFCSKAIMVVQSQDESGNCFESECEGRQVEKEDSGIEGPSALGTSTILSLVGLGAISPACSIGGLRLRAAEQ
jgi:hypothetical protein